jgi:hypothetical protein
VDWARSSIYSALIGTQISRNSCLTRRWHRGSMFSVRAGMRNQFMQVPSLGHTLEPRGAESRGIQRDTGLSAVESRRLRRVLKFAQNTNEVRTRQPENQRRSRAAGGSAPRTMQARSATRRWEVLWRCASKCTPQLRAPSERLFFARCCLLTTIAGPSQCGVHLAPGAGRPAERRVGHQPSPVGVGLVNALTALTPSRSPDPQPADHRETR